MSDKIPANIAELVNMHRFCRPHASETEGRFVEIYIDALPDVAFDKVGNRIGIIGGNPTIMWSSHTDTVHQAAGYQELTWGDGVLSLAADSTSRCLGADCTVGVWLMREMYLAGVPGLYIWHAGEECGGIGSSYIAEETPKLVENIQHAIAFDRRGYDSVVTRQWGGPTASEKFAIELAIRLGGQYKADDTGVFTDTANYADIIPECTNISVGYFNEHSSGEMLDTNFAIWLRDKMLNTDFSDLPVYRDPTDIRQQYRWIDQDWGDYMRQDSKVGKYKSNVYTPKTEVERLEEVIWQYSMEIAELMSVYGYTAEGLKEELIAIYHKNQALKTSNKHNGTVYKLYGGA